MNKYLYGASVQGIQGFIFETNKLKEIAGASQLIDNISSIDWVNKNDLSEFEKYCKLFNHQVDHDEIIMSAAGNIKYKVEDKEILKMIVLGFPKHIANYAPGVTISQAVVEIEDENDIQKSIDKLEGELKAQRNVVTMPIDTGFMGLERARRTGGVAYESNKDGVIDKSTSLKTKMRKEDTLKLFEKFKGGKVKAEEVPFDLNEITKQAENNSWIAIIHADGNGLGTILANMSNKVKKEKREQAFKTFSKQLDVATQSAAKIAFKEIIPVLNPGEKYPIRPVVLGGDDLTVIIRADLAFDFTKAYLRAFEQETARIFKNELKDFMSDIKGLTACAGIAYIKDSYPFHYGIHLAEDLTSQAKNISKSEEVQNKVEQGTIPSSLSFYKVQSSFTDDLEEMKDRTQYASRSKVSFDYGPYFIDDIKGMPNVKELDSKLEVLQNFKADKSKGISKLRQYISELYKDTSKAKFMMDRVSKVNVKFYKDLNLAEEIKKTRMIKDPQTGEDIEQKISLLNDLIQLHTFKEAYNDKN